MLLTPNLILEINVLLREPVLERERSRGTTARFSDGDRDLPAASKARSSSPWS